MSVETIFLIVLLTGWVAATVFTAAVIGNIDNARPGDRAFPAFVFPLLFGFLWPVVLALLIIMAPLGWLANQADKRHDRALTPADGEG